LWIAFVLVILLSLNACVAGFEDVLFTPTAPSIRGIASTYAVQTMVANPNMLLMVYTATPLPASPTPIPTLTEEPRIELASANQIAPGNLPTKTPLPTNTPFTIVTPTSEKPSCINQALFIKDVTIPDNTRLKPGESFSKVWQVKNNGTCTWDNGYSLVFSHGDQLGGLSPMALPTTVRPGEIIDVALNLVAPQAESNFQGNWIFQDSFGNRIGIGEDGSGTLWVAVIVSNSTNPTVSNDGSSRSSRFDRLENIWKGIRLGGGC
jgi:hypothetical protein